MEHAAENDAPCAHWWEAVEGTNDYACRYCGARKGDTGEVYPGRVIPPGKG